MSEALATRRRLLDAPAGPLLSLVPLLPLSGGLALVDVLPTPAGGCLARFASPHAVGEVHLPDAAAEQLVTLPAAVLRSMVRRHRDAVRVAGDLLPSGAMVWRSLSEGAALSLQAHPLDPLPAVMVNREIDDALDGPYPLLFNPSILQRVMGTAKALAGDAVRLVPIWDGGPAGIEVSFTAADPDAVSGWFRVARCINPETQR
jgi:hypothetical protein